MDLIARMFIRHLEEVICDPAISTCDFEPFYRTDDYAVQRNVE